jgi:PKD repeat protein
MTKNKEMKNFLKVRNMSIKILCSDDGTKCVRNRRRLLYFTLFIGIVILFSGCSADNPEANFIPSATTVAVTDTVYFTNNSINASFYQWVFGDGDYAITKNTAHAYTQRGTYTVTLVAIGDNKSNSISKSILVTGIISIFPGIGIIEDSLSDTWASIKNKFSGQDSIMSVDTLEQNWVHSVYYVNKGIIFNFINFSPDTIYSSENPDEIAVINPYAGSTAKGITLGDDISMAKTAYGTPATNTSDGYIDYYYDKLGIQFWTSTTSTQIDEIDVYPVQSTKLKIETIRYNQGRYDKANIKAHQKK